MNYQTLYNIFEKQHQGKDWRTQETKKQVATLFVKWLVREKHLQQLSGE